MKKLMIVGAGGHAKVCTEVAEMMSAWDSIEFLDDCKIGDSVLGCPIVGKTKDILLYRTTHSFFVAIGDNEIRRKIYDELQKNNFQIATLISPLAIVSRFSTLNKGTLVMPAAVIYSGACIGENVIINTATVVEHDCTVQSHSHLSPGVILSGGVSVGLMVWIGSGAVINQQVMICDEVIVGSNSTVLYSILESGIYVGSPVRKIS